MNTAFSGMQAAALRLEAAARNIANADAPNAAPVAAQQSSLVDGGTSATLRRISPGFIAALGTPTAPEADPATELAAITSAKHDVQANAEILRTWDEMLQRLFDLTEDRT